MSDFILARLEPTVRALRAAATPGALKVVIDVATAAEVYARRQKLGDEAIQYASCIKVDALARLGVMLQAAPKANGGEYGGRASIDGTRAEPSNPTPTLADLGIDKKTSAIAQQLADLDASTVESIMAGEVKMTAAIRDARGDVQNVILDVVRGDREKSAHVWQQAQSEAEYYVRELSTEHGTVVDFFLGGGTTAAACKALGRKFIGFEVDAAALERAAGRLAA